MLNIQCCNYSVIIIRGRNVGAGDELGQHACHLVTGIGEGVCVCVCVWVCLCVTGDGAVVI